MARQVGGLFIALFAVLAVDAAVLRGGENMRPDVVAQTLVRVEEEWRKVAADFTESNSSTATGAPGTFAKSCATVVSAVIQGSGGDRNVAKEYMTNVCSQKVLEGWHKLRCSALATAITEHAMKADAYANRQMLDPKKVCSGYWGIFVEAEKQREAEEAKLRAEQDKIRAEQEKKAAEEAAEAKKKADAEAKAEAERRAKEEAERQEKEKKEKAKRDAEEAHERAEEAKKRAAEAAERLAEKKAEAEKVAEEAKKKLEEAAKAEKEHQERLAEHQKAEEMLRNATKTSPTDVHTSSNVTVESAPVLKPAAQEVKKVEVTSEAAPKPKAEEKVADATKPAAAALKNATK